MPPINPMMMATTIMACPENVMRDAMAAMMTVVLEHPESTDKAKSLARTTLDVIEREREHSD